MMSFSSVRKQAGRWACWGFKAVDPPPLKMQIKLKANYNIADDGQGPASSFLRCDIQYIDKCDRNCRSSSNRREGVEEQYEKIKNKKLWQPASGRLNQEWNTSDAGWFDAGVYSSP